MRDRAASGGPPDPAAVLEAARLIRAGRVVAFPTDTFYGLGVDPFNEQAVRSLFAAKGRAPGSPVPVLIASADGLGAIARSIPDGAAALAKRFWPGALTLVLPAVAHLPAIVSAGTGTVGLRVPDHPTPRAIARAVGGPVTGTSANRSGEPPMKRAVEVRAAFGEAIGLIVEGECGDHDEPSTVVDFTVHPPRVLRTGAVHLSELRGVCPTLEA